MKHLLILFCFIVPYFSFSQHKINDYDSIVKALSSNALKIYARHQDSAYYYLNQKNNIAKDQKKWSDAMDAHFETYNIAFYYNNFKKQKTILEAIDALYNTKKQHFDTLDNALNYRNQINYYHGFYSFSLNDYFQSKAAFQNIIDDSEHTDDELSVHDTKLLSVAYSYIAKISTNELKYSQAKELYKKNIRLLERNNDNKSLMFSNINLLAEVLKKEGLHQESNSFFLQSLEHHKNNNNNNSIISSYFNITKNYIQLSKIDSAKFYLNLAHKKLTNKHTYNTTYHELYSEIYSKENNYELALNELNTSLKFSQNRAIVDNKKSKSLASIYTKIGLLHQENNKHDKALQNFNIAINELESENFKSTVNQTTLLRVLKYKSETLNSTKNYKNTLATVDRAILFLDSLKPSFRTNNDKLFLIENAFPLFENGIEAAYNLYQETNDSKYIDEAFFYSEKSKSTLLLESILSSQATTFANIPEELIEKEKQLKARITYLEKQINKKSTPELQDQLFDIKQNHRNLIKDIEVNYKPYFDLKYNTQVLSLNALQNWLDNDTKLISYFYGNYSIYSISVTKNTSYIERLKLDKTFEILLKESYDLISNPNSNLTLLKAKTHELYQKLVLNSLNKSSKEKLIIVPDGLLNYLPFGSLSVNDTQYLIQNHAISYVNSATLLQQLQSKKQHNNRVLAFAPNFDKSNSSTLLALPNNTNEVKQVLSHFKGDAFINDKASLENFNTNNKNFGIIHLATHAILNDKNPEYSYLAFSPIAQNESLLYTNDLYNLELNSNMVTLSACETGLGHLKKGEGMMSLARGFYFSGTSSIASTLWKVNDASSSQLMTDFYGQLSEGKTKDKALQMAKIKFLDSNKDNALSHPYYWSGFIISGNMNTLISSNSWQYIAIGIIILIVLLLMFYRKHRNFN